MPNDEPEPAADEDLPETPADAVGGKAEQVADNDPRRLSLHEAGHAVVGREHGWPVEFVNIDDTKRIGNERIRRMTRFTWGQSWTRIQSGDEQEVLNYVTMLVAGHLAEHEVYDYVKTVRERFEEHPELLERPPDGPGQADRDRVAFWLGQIGCNDMGHVIEAEERAAAILEKQRPAHRALTLALREHEFVAGAQLEEALSAGEQDRC